MSRQRYMVRRIGAVVVLAVVVAGVVKVAGAVVGSGNTTNAESPITDPTSADLAAGDTSSTAPDVAEPTTPAAPDTLGGSAHDGATTVASTVGEPTTAEPPGPRGPPSAADPAVVLIAGDSDAGTFGPYLKTLLSETGIVETVLDYKVSTGLSRPDYYDWPAHFRESVPALVPDIVVVTFGGNDAQGLSIADGTFIHTTPKGEPGGDVEWRAEYGRRVGEVMDFLSADGRTLVWVGIPNDDDPAFTQRLAVQNEVVMAEAAKRPQIVFIDTWKRFSGRNGNWAEWVIDPRDGQGKDVRSDVDGFHLNETGAEILALDIADAIRGGLRARGAQI